MLQKTRGIVVSFVKYGDTSVIVKIFTREMGLRSYIVNGVRASGKANKMAFYQPLTLLDLVVYEKEGKNLQRISEAKLLKPNLRIPFDFHRSGVAMFMAEVLAKSLVEGYHNAAYFDFMEEAVGRLDAETVHLAHFPLAYLLESSRYLGFAPSDADSFFGEMELPLGVAEMLHLEKEYLNTLIAESFEFEGRIPGFTRRGVLDHFLGYFAKHLEIVPDWKSVDVLRQMSS